MHDEHEIKQAVRDRYASHATESSSCCTSSVTRAGAASCGCKDAGSMSEQLGYTAQELALIPEGADLGLGCGNPLALMELRDGETVLDLGSGAGIDCFLAANRVGPAGHVIGVDMTPEMLARARKNAADGGFENVEFRLGEIEHLPVADSSIDAIISNCVVNLVPNKTQVFAEAFRVLKPGGRISLSDIVLLGEVPVALSESVDAYVSCLSGAILKEEYLRLMEEAGFTDIQVVESRPFGLGDVLAEDLISEFVRQSKATREELEAAAAVFESAKVQARRPQ